MHGNLLPGKEFLRRRSNVPPQILDQSGRFRMGTGLFCKSIRSARHRRKQHNQGQQGDKKECTWFHRLFFLDQQPGDKSRPRPLGVDSLLLQRRSRLLFASVSHMLFFDLKRLAESFCHSVGIGATSSFVVTDHVLTDAYLLCKMACVKPKCKALNRPVCVPDCAEADRQRTRGGCGDWARLAD